MQKIIPLNQLIGKLSKRNPPRFKSIPNTVFAHHVTHGDVFSHVANEIQKRPILKPVVVVHHLRFVATIAKLNKLFELRFLTSNIVIYRFNIQQLTLIGFTAGIAYHACCSAHQSDRNMTGALEMHQLRYWYEISNVQ